MANFGFKNKKKKNKISPKWTFLLLNLLIMCLFMISCAYLTLKTYLSAREDDFHNNLDTFTHFAAAKIKDDRSYDFLSVPLNYILFIINADNASYVSERPDTNTPSNDLWEKYRSKLIYEMQKKKNGWIYYPDKESKDFAAGQRVIRYLLLEDLNWILCVETIVPIADEAVTSLISTGYVFILLILTLIALVIVYLSANRYFLIIKKHIIDTLESNLINTADESLWNDSSKNDNIEKMVLEDKISTEGTYIKKNLDYNESALNGGSSLLSSKPSSGLTLEQEPAKKDPAASKKEEPPTEEPGSPLDDLTLNIKNIKSPVLKKLINDIRAK